MGYSYPERVLIGIDQLCNSLLGGSPDETFSARCWRKRARQPWTVLRLLVDGIFFWQRDAAQRGHCQQAWKSEMIRAQLPKSYHQGDDYAR